MNLIHIVLAKRCWIVCILAAEGDVLTHFCQRRQEVFVTIEASESLKVWAVPRLAWDYYQHVLFIATLWNNHYMVKILFSRCWLFRAT